MKHQLTAYVIALLLGTSAVVHAQPAVPDGPGSERRNVGFWLSVGAGGNSVFDDQTVRMLASRARYIIFNAPVDGPAPQYEYGAVVKRFHEVRPGLPVLIYTWATYFRESPRIGTATLEGFPNLGPLLLRDQRGEEVRKRGGGHLMGDPRHKGYREWHADKVVAMVRRMGADGVHLDGTARTHPAAVRKRVPNAAEDYGRAVETMFQHLKSRLGGKMLTYNGLWAHKPGLLSDQERLLTFADGATVEFFGAPEKEGGGAHPFREGIAPFLRIMTAHPRKLIHVVARGPLTYTKYDADYAWQRYLYASYLMAAGPETVFKYQADFPTVPRDGSVRTGSLDLYADWDVDAGEPQGAYQERGGVYSRRFSKGLVLMSPHDGSGGTYQLSKTMYTPEGEPLDGRVTVKAGQGLLLLEAQPKPRTLPVQDFRASRPAAASWRWAQVSDVDGKRALRLERTPENEQWEHDLMLDPVRSLRPATSLRVRARTKDENATLLFVAEVDDQQGKEIYVVVPAPANGKARGGQLPGMPFRATGGGRWPVVPGRGTAWGDGTWQDVTLDGAKIADGRYTFKRWSHVRIVGTVDIQEVELTRGADQS